jgi:hypothetical protein
LGEAVFRSRLEKVIDAACQIDQADSLKRCDFAPKRSNVRFGVAPASSEKPLEPVFDEA